MLKKILRILGKVINVLFVIVLIMTMSTVLQSKVELKQLAQGIDRELSDLNYRCNKLFDNDLELLGQIQGIDTKITDTVVDTQALLNSDVFVRGIDGMGAGTVIKKTNDEMYILTCYHVISEIMELNKSGIDFGATIGYSKNDKTDTLAGYVVYGAKVIKADEEKDLALLKVYITDDHLVAVSLATEEPQKGDTVYSVGSPLGFLRTISKGILSNKQDGFYFSDNTITFGNSGGGLYNSKAELIGVPSNVHGYQVGNDYVPETSLGLSIPLSVIKEFLKDQL
jgi:S1-C subfamily serine protease